MRSMRLRHELKPMHAVVLAMLHTPSQRVPVDKFQDPQTMVVYDDLTLAEVLARHREYFWHLSRRDPAETASYAATSALALVAAALDAPAVEVDVDIMFGVVQHLKRNKAADRHGWIGELFRNCIPVSFAGRPPVDQHTFPGHTMLIRLAALVKAIINVGGAGAESLLETTLQLLYKRTGQQ